MKELKNYQNLLSKFLYGKYNVQYRKFTYDTLRKKITEN